MSFESPFKSAMFGAGVLFIYTASKNYLGSKYEVIHELTPKPEAFNHAPESYAIFHKLGIYKHYNVKAYEEMMKYTDRLLLLLTQLSNGSIMPTPIDIPDAETNMNLVWANMIEFEASCTIAEDLAEIQIQKEKLRKFLFANLKDVVRLCRRLTLSRPRGKL